MKESYPNLDECKSYAKTIMLQTEMVLEKESIRYRSLNGNTEIVILNPEKNVDEIRDLIESALTIPKIITSMLLEIKSGGSDVFIRLRYK